MSSGHTLEAEDHVNEWQSMHEQGPLREDPRGRAAGSGEEMCILSPTQQKTSTYKIV